jgi:hypothetical protein
MGGKALNKPPQAFQGLQKRIDHPFTIGESFALSLAFFLIS